jgi:hypothetical protein
VRRHRQKALEPPDSVNPVLLSIVQDVLFYAITTDILFACGKLWNTLVFIPKGTNQGEMAVFQATGV